MDMRILKNNDDIIVLQPEGSLDLCGSVRLKDCVIKLLEQKVEGIIIDLGKITAIESAGIGALINISSTLGKIRLPLAIINISEAVGNAMKAAKYAGYLPIASGLREAVDLVKSS